MIKVGQVRKAKKTGLVFVITFVDEKTVCSVDNQGMVYDSRLAHNLIEANSDVIGKYPTWQEAVNSFEFNRYTEFKEEVNSKEFKE